MVESLYKFYKGFYLDRPVGNNAFSFEKRRHKRIWVPPLIEGTVEDIKIGRRIVFSEIEDGVEKNRAGLSRFVYLRQGKRHIFVFDNHNHAFFFWCWAWKCGLIDGRDRLTHIDQHSDMYKPEVLPDRFLLQKDDLREAFEYTNYQLNVGNFIKPALELGIFPDVDIWMSLADFGDERKSGMILDLDMDVFAEDMQYIPQTLKLEAIREAIQRAHFITIASSPFFVDQGNSVHLIQKILS